MNSEAISDVVSDMYCDIKRKEKENGTRKRSEIMRNFQN